MLCNINIHDLVKVVIEIGIGVSEVKENEHAFQIVTTEKAYINLFPSTKKITVQGKKKVSGHIERKLFDYLKNRPNGGVANVQN